MSRSYYQQDHGLDWQAEDTRKPSSPGSREGESAEELTLQCSGMSEDQPGRVQSPARLVQPDAVSFQVPPAYHQYATKADSCSSIREGHAYQQETTFGKHLSATLEGGVQGLLLVVATQR
jgi:hypothetical protein